MKVGKPGSPDSPVDEHIREVELTGFTVLGGVVPREEVAEVRDSIASTVDDKAGYSETGVGFLATILNHDRSIVPYLADPRLLGVVDRLLGPFAHVSFASAIINAPGNERGKWHADWPFNQEVAGHVTAPYPDVVMHLTTLWMLSPFATQTGGTLVVPGSHRSPSNPTAENGFDRHGVLPGEVNATGEAGDVLLFDSRLWHATAKNTTTEPRVALAIRFAPWWLDVSVLRPGSRKRAQMVDETGAVENEAPSLRRRVFEDMPRATQTLFRHMVE
ncbi:MAG: phytanoyl-CoA dioxygenase family protein [Acidimicrobiia bacterium]